MIMFFLPLPYGFSFYADSEIYLNILFGRISNHYYSLRLFPFSFFYINGNNLSKF